MLEMMLAAAGSADGGTTFTITPNATSFNEGSEIVFTIIPENHTVGHLYHWSVGGSIHDEHIADPIEGTITFTDDSPVEVRLRTLSDEFKEDDETLTLRIHYAKDGVAMGESPIVNVLYSSMPVGQHTQTASGRREWIVPEGVTEISVVTVGGGQGADGVPRGRGGDGASLRWRNKIPVTPGEALTLEVGRGGMNSTDPQIRQGGNTTLYRGTNVLLRAAGGGNIGSTSLATDNVGGGDGGRGALGGEHGPGGGGGAGGYSGNGGVGGNALVEAGDGEGGGGGGGNYYATTSSDSHHATAGGGVGLAGQSANGAAGIRGDALQGGKGGSDGGNGDWITTGIYGGGARGQSSNVNFGSVNGGSGAIRLIWGPMRLYPNTRTGNL